MQKYRLYLRRLSRQPQNGLGSSFLGSQDAGQALASSAHSLGRVTNKSGTSLPIVDQRNIFSFDNPNIRFLAGQQHHNNGRQVNPLHGIPANMDSKQLVALNQSAQPFGKMHMNVHLQSGQGNSLLTQLVQQQSRTQMLNEVGGNQLLSPRSCVGPPGLSQAVPGSVFSRYGMDNVRAPTYTSLSQNVETSQHQGRLDVAPSVLVPPGFASDHRNGHMRTTSVNKEAFSAATSLGNGTNLRQQLTPSHAGSSLRIKTERLPDMGLQNSLFPDQQQGGSVPVEDGFGFNEYQQNNLPV